MKAVLALEGTDFKRHKDVVGYFNKTYVATSIFPREVGKRLGRLQMVREESDYSDFFIASKEDAEKQCDTAEFIINFSRKNPKNVPAADCSENEKMLHLDLA